jgi:response regulator RpfG family c-di-GMP phosphodiesterase
VADTYDRLVHGHKHQARLTREDALATLAAARDRWRADVYEALMRVTAQRAV